MSYPFVTSQRCDLELMDRMKSRNIITMETVQTICERKRGLFFILIYSSLAKVFPFPFFISCSLEFCADEVLLDLLRGRDAQGFAYPDISPHFQFYLLLLALVGLIIHPSQILCNSFDSNDHLPSNSFYDTLFISNCSLLLHWHHLLLIATLSTPESRF